MRPIAWMAAWLFTAGVLLPASGVAGQACAPGDFLVIGSKQKEFAPVKISRERFTALPSTTVVTSTSWTSVSRYEGPQLSEVMKLAPARGPWLRLYALDGYTVRVPWSDMGRFKMILSHSRNGVPLTVQDFGPLFLVYPRDEFPAIMHKPSEQAKFIWQVCRIDVE